MLIVTAGAFGAAAYYAHVARQQREVMQNTYAEIQKQTTTQHQQLVGTLEAVIRIQSVQWDPDRREVTIQFSNDLGGVNGMLTDFRATVQRKTLPNQQLIGKPIPITFWNQKVPKGQNFLRSESLPWPLPEADLNIWPGNEVVTLEGQLTYDNGFDEKFSHNFCYFWLPPWQLQMPGPNRFGWSGGTSSGWSTDGQSPCQIVAAENYFFSHKRMVDEAKARQH